MWDGENRLIELCRDVTWTEQSDTVFLYDGWNLIAELNANDGNPATATIALGGS